MYQRLTEPITLHHTHQLLIHLHSFIPTQLSTQKSVPWRTFDPWQTSTTFLHWYFASFFIFGKMQIIIKTKNHLHLLLRSLPLIAELLELSIDLVSTSISPSTSPVYSNNKWEDRNTKKTFLENIKGETDWYDYRLVRSRKLHHVSSCRQCSK